MHCEIILSVNCIVVDETGHSKLHASLKTMNLKRNAKIHTFIDKQFTKLLYHALKVFFEKITLCE